MIGRRIQHVDGQDPFHELTQPGDYCGPLYGRTGDLPAVYFIIPEPAPWDEALGEDRNLKGLAHVCSPPHTFRECPDGSLEIRNSILCKRQWAGQEWQWHGFLDEGHVWRTA